MFILCLLRRRKRFNASILLGDVGSAITAGAVWDALVEARVARFPFPTYGRIPNCERAREAAEHLLAHPLFQSPLRQGQPVAGKANN